MPAVSTVSDMSLECVPHNMGTLVPNRFDPDFEAFNAHMDVVELNIGKPKIVLCYR